jgi:hypothetical protein
MKVIIYYDSIMNVYDCKRERYRKIQFFSLEFPKMD